MNLTKQFFKYVSQNIFGLLGTSCYILVPGYADRFMRHLIL